MISDGELIQIVDSAVAEAARRAGAWLTCRPGCTHCCIGPFAVTLQDTVRLAAGAASLAEPVRVRIWQRAAEAREAMRPGFPGDWARGGVDSQAAADQFDAQHPWLPCPVLDLETGTCALHESRPVACRLHGPALRIDGQPVQHCRLNYTGATAAEIEACRVNMETPAVPDSELTYIAWAFMP